MKKHYMAPSSEIVQVRLHSSVLENTAANYGTWSDGIGGKDPTDPTKPIYGDAKEGNIWDSGFDETATPKGGGSNIWSSFESMDNL